MDALINNMAKGDLHTFNKPVFPKGEITGVGFHEAPRGALSHWVVIEDGKIKNYQCVVPSTWNACPRNEADEPDHTKPLCWITRWPIRSSRLKCCARCTLSTHASPAPSTLPILGAGAQFG